MKGKTKQRLVLAGIVVVLAAAWFLIPGPFAHGVIVGLTAGTAAVLGGLSLLMRFLKKRMGSRLAPPPLPTSSWDYDLDVTDLDGVPVSFSEARGQVVVLNFWATWCAPCVAEMPSLQRLREATQDLDVRFAFITSEEAPIVRKFAEKRGLELPVYLMSGERPECFKGHAIPATFVMDRSGMIAMRHFGAAAWDADNVVAFVRGLAATPGG